MAQTTPALSTNVPLSEEQYSGTTVTRPGFNRDPRILRNIVTSEAAKRNCKAIEFGMWVDDNKILTMALGNSMTDVPALTTMHYRIGGIAETFMSTLLLMLVKQHRIDLDWTIGRWFPGLLAADQVTFRMLVANTAGYIDYVAVPDFVNLQESQPFRAFTDDELINYSVRDGKMNFLPSTNQRYSHTDNVILGQAIERATGRSIKQLYNENLFGPLGLENTYFPIDQNIKDPVLHAFTSERSVKDHPFYEDCTYWNPSWGSTPGLPISNLDDLSKWGPILGTGRLLTPELFREQIAPTSVGKGTNKPDAYFAFGFVVTNGWIVQNPAVNGYSGAFGYSMPHGVTVTLAATKSETSTTDFAAFEILREVVKYVTPDSPIAF